MSKGTKPVKGLIHARFDLIIDHNQDSDLKGLFRLNLPTVPNPGQSISLNGNPFLVHSVGWAASDDNENILFAYVRIVKHHDYKIES